MTNIILAIVVLFITIILNIIVTVSIYFRLIDIPKWHMNTHANYDFMKVAESNKMIDHLQKEKKELGAENKKLKLQLEIKGMNDFLEGR